MEAPADQRLMVMALQAHVQLARQDAATLMTTFFQQFFKTEAAGGVLLLVSAGAALIAANSPWAEAYHGMWAARVTIGAGGHDLSLTLHQWINDGLMAVFFLLVGLEVKRETLAGELSSPRQAALPIAGAIGGMVVPIGLYLAASGGGVAQRGWAVAMATDIAFALGALAMVAPRAPAGLKIFLAALAIVDDIGAILVIALFYSGPIAWTALAMAALCAAVLIAFNRLHIRALAPYLLTGVALWFFVHESGVHATIAGIVLAMAIPIKTRINSAEYSAQARALLDDFDRTETGDLLVLTSKGQQEAIFAIGRANLHVLAPLLRLEHALHGLSAFVVMPLFAFSNAGVTLSGLPVDRVTLAVFLGLAIGKPIGITGAAFTAVRAHLAGLPQGVSWGALHGCGWLGGIGFTMSLFIATLAFEGTPLLAAAKVGILTASAFSGIVGAVVVRSALRR
jgi:Na+:H+ antiporter, NhaA family